MVTAEPIGELKGSEMSKADSDVETAEPDDTPADEELQNTAPEAEEADASTADDDDGVVVTIGEDSPPPEEDEQRAPEWVRELRKSNREKDAEIRRLKEQAGQTTTQAVAVGAKPKLEDCEYDTERFERELESWHERKRTADQQDADKRSADQKAQAEWNARLEHHSKLKGELKVKDFDETEAIVDDALSVTQRGLIVHGADNSAVVKYALGKNPAKLKTLASITDPVKFAFAVAKLETQLKVTPRKAAPIPERSIRSNASTTGSVANSELEKLRAEAVKTGDLSKVVAYKHRMKAAERK